MREEDRRLRGRAQPPPADLPAETRHRLLADDRRRRLLAVLEAADAPLSLEDVSERVDARERSDSGGPTGTTANPGTDSAVAVSLHHVHLPMLDDAGVVTYDPETRTVLPAGHWRR